MKKFKRIITIVLDSVGIGEAPDAAKFNDFGVDTLGNIAKKVGLNLPNLEKMGLGNIAKIKTIQEVENPLANYGKMQEQANGKDSIAGHWEMMGVTIKQPFKVYIANGFPQELVDEFSRLTGRDVLANKEANGMQVIKEYYDEHVKTGGFILYTSVDSTFQIAAHEDIIPLAELYKACEIARELTKDKKYNVARVIARPFIGESKDNFERTANRHDYALTPPQKTVMQNLVKHNIEVTAIGKITDIYNGVGITKAIKTQSNMDGVDKTIEAIQSNTTGFIFTNLVDFDSKYGHPRDVSGYKQALEDFDQRLPQILNVLSADDLLILTADHGNDPTYQGNDHTREYVPLLVYNKNLQGNNKLKLRKTFEDLGQTIADNFESEGTLHGNSFLNELQ
ncbi:MAG: phosphopentomutase [Mycoplasmatales bacterium]